MIKNKYIPLKITSMYSIIKKFKNDELPLNITWTTLETHGRKPYLSKRGLLNLIDEIKKSTDGGFAMLLAEIRDLVKEKIKGAIQK